MDAAKIAALNKYVPGTLAQRKTKFNRMLEQARKYRLGSLDQSLQAMIAINTCYDLQESEFAAKTAQMVELLKLYGGYTPSPSETQKTAALKVSNKLSTTVSEQCFALITARAL